MALGISELYGGHSHESEKQQNITMFKTHVALPAIVQSFNASKQTVDVQPAIREKMIDPDNKIYYQQYPLLINVPIVFPQAGGYSITFPINRGDECIVIFSDLAIDNWWESGGVQNPVEQRRHDLSDGIAIFGLKNQSRISSVPSSLTLRGPNGDRIEVTGSGVNVYSTSATVQATNINLKGTVNITGSTTVDGNFTVKNGIVNLN